MSPNEPTAPSNEEQSEELIVQPDPAIADLLADQLDLSPPKAEEEEPPQQQEEPPQKKEAEEQPKEEQKEEGKEEPEAKEQPEEPEELSNEQYQEKIDALLQKLEESEARFQQPAAPEADKAKPEAPAAPPKEAAPPPAGDDWLTDELFDSLVAADSKEAVASVFNAFEGRVQRGFEQRVGRLKEEIFATVQEQATAAAQFTTAISMLTTEFFRSEPKASEFARKNPALWRRIVVETQQGDPKLSYPDILPKAWQRARADYGIAVRNRRSATGPAPPEAIKTPGPGTPVPKVASGEADKQQAYLQDLIKEE